MRLLHMYHFKKWLETHALTEEQVYVFCKDSEKLEEHPIFKDPKLYPKVPIGTNPFN